MTTSLQALAETAVEACQDIPAADLALVTAVWEQFHAASLAAGVQDERLTFAALAGLAIPASRRPVSPMLAAGTLADRVQAMESPELVAVHELCAGVAGAQAGVLPALSAYFAALSALVAQARAIVVYASVEAVELEGGAPDDVV